MHCRCGHWNACNENGVVTTGVRNEGNAARGGVRDANKIARRVAWCIAVLRERGVECILENPVRSMLFTFPSVLNMLLAWGFFTIVGDMCRFAAPDASSVDIPQKRLRFLGSAWWTVALGQRCRHRGNHKPLMKKEGKFSGGGKDLAESAAYAVRFCFFVIDVYVAMRLKTALWEDVKYPVYAEESCSHSPEEFVKDGIRSEVPDV